jgi:hypothetical protein
MYYYLIQIMYKATKARLKRNSYPVACWTAGCGIYPEVPVNDHLDTAFFDFPFSSRKF